MLSPSGHGDTQKIFKAAVRKISSMGFELYRDNRYTPQ
jgi:hypothetical protein